MRIFIFLGMVAGFSQFSFGQVRSASFVVGNSQFTGWTNLTTSRLSGYGGWPGYSPWPVGISGDVDGSGKAKLNRLAGSTNGGPFPAFTSLYFASRSQSPNEFGGRLAVVDTNPTAGVRTILLQVQIGEVLGYGFVDPSGYPILKINRETNGLVTSFSPKLLGEFPNGSYFSPATMKNEPIICKTWAFQWNLTNEPTVNEFSIEFSCVTHSQIYALQLDQTSVLQAAQIFSIPSSPPQIGLLNLGTPQFDAGSGITTITHSFSGPTNQTIDIEFTPNLLNPNWSTNAAIATGTGTFTNTFSALGDQRAVWSEKMFFRAKYSGR